MKDINFSFTYVLSMSVFRKLRTQWTYFGVRKKYGTWKSITSSQQDCNSLTYCSCHLASFLLFYSWNANYVQDSELSVCLPQTFETAYKFDKASQLIFRREGAYVKRKKKWGCSWSKKWWSLRTIYSQCKKWRMRLKRRVRKENKHLNWKQSCRL